MPRPLLDSHVLLWFVAGDRRRLSAKQRKGIESGAVVSTASLWELAIKISLGKLDAPEDLPARVEELGFDRLPVTAEHAWQVRRLPHHHGDPFDRLLIAQAQLERLPIVSADAALAAYDVELIWED